MERTLYDLSDLRESRFGQPRPRHGLKLLWWFVHECVWIDANQCLIAKCDPDNGSFGFHRFFNREKLLPRANLPYYEVGNLNNTDSLPPYVTKSYTGNSDKSNTDRIIVSYDSTWKRFDRIYVTRHSDLKNFDRNHTFHISPELIKIIKEMNREDFLRKHTSQKTLTRPMNDTHIDIPHPEQRQCSQKQICAGLCCGISMLLIIGAVVLVSKLLKLF